LYFAKGKSCSLHYHKNKDETFYIQSGKLELYYSDDLKETLKHADNVKTAVCGTPALTLYDCHLTKVTLTKGDNFYIPPGRVHQMFALEDTELFEFSTLHEDSDSYRILKGD